jgi:hypothetical protein
LLLLLLLLLLRLLPVHASVRPAFVKAARMECVRTPYQCPHPASPLVSNNSKQPAADVLVSNNTVH